MLRNVLSSGTVEGVPDPPSAISVLDRRLKRFLISGILLLTAGYTFLDYWEYSRVQHADPQTWALLVSGRGLAPAQYRIGVYFTANFFAQLTHLQLRHVFAVSDLLYTGLALACIFYPLTRMPWFRRASLPAQWAQALLALLLVQVYLVWTLWFQEPETMPSLAILAVSGLLCSGLIRVPKPMLAVWLLLLAVLGATIRVDVVLAFYAGMLAACLVSRRDAESKTWLVATSVVAIMAALGIERFIAHNLFLSAERSAPLFQLIGNLESVNGVLALLSTMPAWVLTVWLASRSWTALPVWLRGLVLGSVVHFAMFMAFGMSEEVRIFLPFTLTLAPLSAALLYQWLAGEGATLPN
jgi:hypothetical protein